MRELPATVVGISAQDVESHNSFQQKHSIPVPLLADVDKSVAKSYGVSAPMVGTRRAVIVVDEQGIIRHRFVHRLGLDFQTVDDIKAVLDRMPAAAGTAPA
jgi:peroxiredoxin Q/BCP